MIDEQKTLVRDLLFSFTNMAAMTSRENPRLAGARPLKTINLGSGHYILLFLTPDECTGQRGWEPFWSISIIYNIRGRSVSHSETRGEAECL